MLTVISYRFAHLLVPLQDIWHGVVVGELHMAVEDDALAEDGRDVHGVFCKKDERKDISCIHDLLHTGQWELPPQPGFPNVMRP